MEETTGLLSRRNDLSRPPSLWKRAIVMTSCFFLQLTVSGTGYALSVAYVEIIRQFDSTRAETAVIQSIYFGLMFIAAILWAGPVKKLGFGVSAIIGTFVATGGLVASSFPQSVAFLIIFAGVVTGTGSSVIYYTSFLTVTSVFSDNRQVAVSLLTVGAGVGQAAFPYIYEALLEEFYLGGSFLILAGIMFNCLACGVIIFFESGDNRHIKSNSTLSEREEPIFDWSLLKDGVIIVLLLCNFVLLMTGPIEGFFLVDMFVLRGYKRETGSLITSAIGLASIFGRIYGGLVLISKKVHELLHASYLILIVGVMHALIGYVTNYPVLVVACLVYGFSYGAVIAQYPSLALRIVGMDRYRPALALWNMTLGFGVITGEILGGYITDQTSSYDVLFLFAAICSACLSVTYLSVFLFLKFRGRIQTELPRKNGYFKLGDDNGGLSDETRFISQT